MDLDPEAFTAEALLSLSWPRAPTMPEDTQIDDTIDHDADLDASRLVLSAQNETAEQLRSQTHSWHASEEFKRQFLHSMCSHETCAIDGALSMALGFDKMDKTERVNFVRCMLFALSSPASSGNMLFRDSTISTRKRGRETGLPNSSTTKSTTAYAVHGQRVCIQAFSAITQLSSQVIMRHARDVSTSVMPIQYTTLKATNRKGKVGIQRIVVNTFLITVASDFGMECPRGRGSRNESPLRLLPSSFTKTFVYGSYRESWQGIMQGLLEFRPDISPPPAPIHFNLFIRYWSEDMPLLRVASVGSDFCDTCTTLKNSIDSLSTTDIRFSSTHGVLSAHLDEAKSEFRNYKKCRVKSNNTGSDNHLVFDFAEKVLLPRLQKQPGQLHFITGLKFDIFGVSSSNLSRNFVFGLTEGHWPNEKTANTVLSMLHYTIAITKQRGVSSRHLLLNSDNCSGQNKNRFVLWYLAWRVLVGLEDDITLSFLVAGHTKNVCDGAFGHVKRKLLTTEAKTPHDMMRIIDNSSISTTCVPASEVYWRDWKAILEQYFTMPSACKISKGHVFRFEASTPFKLKMKKLSTSSVEESFMQKKRGIPELAPVFSYTNDMSRPMFDFKITSLDNVKSQQYETRRNYLKVNILDRYYKDDPLLQKEFFEVGSCEDSQLSYL